MRAVTKNRSTGEASPIWGEALLVEIIASIPGEPRTLYKDLCMLYAYREIARIECMN